MPDANYKCSFRFDNQDPAYCYGVEFGMLWPKLQGTEDIAGYFVVQNQEQITRAAEQFGWHVLRMEPWGDEWVFFHLSKSAPGTLEATDAGEFPDSWWGNPGIDN